MKGKHLDVALRTYIETADYFYMEDRLDAAMEVVNDAFEDAEWPAGAWDAFYNELVCEKDARDASIPREVDGIKIEMDRNAPEHLIKVVSRATVEARAKVVDTMQVEFARPVMVTVFQPDAATEFIPGPYGYVMHKNKLDKICLPRHAVTSFEESLEALTHEFTHVAVFAMGGDEVPAWINEGIAGVLAHGAKPALDAAATDIISRNPRLISIRRVQHALVTSDMRKDDPQQVYAAYCLADSVIRWWIGRFGLESVRNAIREMGERRNPDRAIRNATGLSRGRLEREWRRSLGVK